MVAKQMTPGHLRSALEGLGETTPRGTLWGLARALDGRGTSSATWLDIAKVFGISLNDLCPDLEWQARCRDAVRNRAATQRNRSAPWTPTPIESPGTTPMPAPSPAAPTPTPPSLSDLAAQLVALEAEAAAVQARIAETKAAMRAALS